ncbi:MAG TPA: hypothetical protein PK453_06575 [Leptospiraceae bacterium]|nr:hypothetical protein [Leptospiraceae bacterium]HNF13317.1 hypothetical protein [Leptospiraceae bacterium]HNI96607.1 hypothetical protein [Leptospiraceae bacterium]HNM03749.1 hypothetical protein [Leptospiraceae bacterium]HNO23529.1 hypothetical protein [Leptospiraceae bacterium]
MSDIDLLTSINSWKPAWSANNRCIGWYALGDFVGLAFSWGLNIENFAVSESLRAVSGTAFSVYFLKRGWISEQKDFLTMHHLRYSLILSLISAGAVLSSQYLAEFYLGPETRTVPDLAVKSLLFSLLAGLTVPLPFFKNLIKKWKDENKLIR